MIAGQEARVVPKATPTSSLPDLRCELRLPQSPTANVILHTMAIEERDLRKN